ncbi:Scr1 family TA system antitoxin-like transcriptional regulator [Streptomyces sp. ISL-87]|uniref:helix-turn-helix domain-containing protein n=1 Tax=Streptomyces sp. ISL-87 TaxID=2819188 RepID=UPI0035ABFBEB
MGRPRKELDRTTPAGLLGAKVRDLQDLRGLTVKELAAKLFISESRLIKIQTANDPPNKDMVERLTAVLDAGDSLTELYPLMSLASFKDYARPFLAKQAKAKTIKEFSLLIPGLLQTQAYAAALMRLGDPEGQEEEIQVAAERRYERQEVLEGPDAPWLWVVLDRGAVTKVIGSRAIMREQMEHLLKVVQMPNIHVQILPPHCPTVGGSISVLTSRTGEVSAYTEGFDVGRYMLDAEDAERFQRIYDQLHAEALSPSQSEELIREALGTYT